ncbi:MAG: hypothetical protein ACK4VO_08975 [Pseudobdellovibrio sp.]
MFNLKSLFTMRLMFFAYLAMVVFLVTSCQNNNDDEQNAINANCVYNPAACQANLYNQTPGFTPYNYYGYGYVNGSSGPFHYLNNSAYLCNCPAGTIPTYNSYAGLGCVQSNYISGFNYSFMSLNGSTTNNSHWVNIPQISNIQGYTTNGCYNGVVQSCVVSNASTCLAGYVCRPTTAASAIGLCVSTSANNQTGQIFR